MEVSSTFSLAIDDGIDDEKDNTLRFVDKEDVHSCVDPDFNPCGDTISWKKSVPQTDFDLLVRSNDNGQIPHFHVIDHNTRGSQFSSCIRIDTPEYFRHGYHRNTLNSSEKKALVEFLQKVSPHDSMQRTNWGRIVDEWNKNTMRAQVRCTKMPSYQQLPNKS